MRDGGSQVEALTVDINVNRMKIACTTAYGPQEKDPRDKKENFWQFLEEEAIRADIEGKGFILQGDLNAWLGNSLISKDPRKQNDNGKLMEGFMTRNQLTVVNGLSLCKGVFTRIRKTKNNTERGILDFFVVCNRILPLIKSMDIDESKKNVPTNYTQVKKGGKAVDSDHVPIEMELDIKILPTRPTRETIYNFKNLRGREIFRNLTTKTNDFTDIFSSMEPLLEQCEKWKIMLDSYCKRSFPRLRVTQRKGKPSEADKFIQQRNALKIKEDSDKITHIEKKKLHDLESKIANILAEEGRYKALKFKKFCLQNGSVSVSEMWKLKKTFMA